MLHGTFKGVGSGAAITFRALVEMGAAARASKLTGKFMPVVMGGFCWRILSAAVKDWAQTGFNQAGSVYITQSSLM